MTHPGAWGEDGSGRRVVLAHPGWGCAVPCAGKGAGKAAVWRGIVSLSLLKLLIFNNCC